MALGLIVHQYITRMLELEWCSELFPSSYINWHKFQIMGGTKTMSVTFHKRLASSIEDPIDDALEFSESVVLGRLFVTISMSNTIIAALSSAILARAITWYSRSPACRKNFNCIYVVLPARVGRARRLWLSDWWVPLFLQFVKVMHESSKCLIEPHLSHDGALEQFLEARWPLQRLQKYNICFFLNFFAIPDSSKSRNPDLGALEK